MIFAMLGLWELAPVAPKSAAGALWQQGVNSLEALIDQFDLGNWSAYGISGSPVLGLLSMQYHLQHVALLEVLARLTGQSVFGQFSARFAAYARNPINRLRAGIGLVRTKMSDARGQN